MPLTAQQKKTFASCSSFEDQNQTLRSVRIALVKAFLSTLLVCQNYAQLRLHRHSKHWQVLHISRKLKIDVILKFQPVPTSGFM